MSTSHAAVGEKFGRGQPAKGSRMESVGTSTKISPHFTVVAAGISYRTKIAQIVVNHHTQLSELWLTPNYYSQTTNRHEGYFRDGFIKAYTQNHGCSREVAQGQIFVTDAVAAYHTDRCNSDRAKAILQHIHAQLPDVDKPRLRSATRMGALMSCLTRTREAIRRMAHGVPVDYPDAQTLYELQDMEAFIANTMALYRNDTPDSIDEVRASVRAWLELNNPRNN